MSAVPHVQNVDALPDPPYPSEVRSRGWRFEFDTERIRASDTWAIADPMTRPWLLMLWVTAWHNHPVSLPGDERAIAGQIGMPIATFQANRDVLLRGWKMHSDGRLYHQVLTERVLEMVNRRGTDAKRVANWRANRKQWVTEDVTRNQRVTNALVTREYDTYHLPPIKPKSIGRSAPASLPEGFTRFWAAYPNHSGRRKSKATCAVLWQRLGLEALADAVVAHVEAMSRTPQWRTNNEGESFEPEAERYLRKRQFEDELPTAAKSKRPAL